MPKSSSNTQQTTLLRISNVEGTAQELIAFLSEKPCFKSDYEFVPPQIVARLGHIRVGKTDPVIIRGPPPAPSFPDKVNWPKGTNIRILPIEVVGPVEVGSRSPSPMHSPRRRPSASPKQRPRRSRSPSTSSFHANTDEPMEGIDSSAPITLENQSASSSSLTEIPTNPVDIPPITPLSPIPADFSLAVAMRSMPLSPIPDEFPQGSVAEALQSLQSSPGAIVATQGSPSATYEQPSSPVLLPSRPPSDVPFNSYIMSETASIESLSPPGSPAVNASTPLPSSPPSVPSSSPAPSTPEPASTPLPSSHISSLKTRLSDDLKRLRACNNRDDLLRRLQTASPEEQQKVRDYIFYHYRALLSRANDAVDSAELLVQATM